MKLQEIKDAVKAGKTVHWSNEAYVVICYGEQWDILCLQNRHAIGLTWRDGITMNGKEEDFYIQGGTK